MNGDITQMIKSFKQFINEDGMGGGAVVSAGPSNVVGSGAIAGSGGKGGEPGVHLPRRKNSPVMGTMNKRKIIEK